ncbi:alpha/beta fold hydrolase [Nakamurella endophytica]|uniref:AB hydrolase-1 domain-containing protein n=1 Tax=Nakamurella endophytica TaxID=1748367 RepID=A0A917T1Y2_9ACTN|nr:alpha/beta hydrolase [Nakamurella endophytica]GGM05396.1 hypothetical protein GCM10011594_27030 [Nakamurella endophytica]
MTTVPAPTGPDADRTARGEGAAARPHDPVDRSVNANGIRFHLVEAGSGPLVLLLPGFGQTAGSWRHQLRDLAAAGYRAAAPDLRGTGESDKTPRGYDAFTLAEDVAGLVGALGERSAVLVGQGYGGTLAFDVATMHPDRVRGVVAIAAPHPARLAAPRLPSRTPYRRLLRFAAAPLFPDRRLAAGNGARLERIVHAAAGPQWTSTAEYTSAVADMRRSITIPGAAKGAVEQLRWVARSPWRTDGRRHREALQSGVHVPVLHLAGDADRFVPLEELTDAARHCHGAYRLRVVPGAGHYPPEEAPEVVDRLVVEFLRALDGGPTPATQDRPVRRGRHAVPAAPDGTTAGAPRRGRHERAAPADGGAAAAADGVAPHAADGGAAAAADGAGTDTGGRAPVRPQMTLDAALRDEPGTAGARVDGRDLSAPAAALRTDLAAAAVQRAAAAGDPRPVDDAGAPAVDRRQARRSVGPVTVRATDGPAPAGVTSRPVR